MKMMLRNNYSNTKFLYYKFSILWAKPIGLDPSKLSNNVKHERKQFYLREFLPRVST